MQYRGKCHQSMFSATLDVLYMAPDSRREMLITARLWVVILWPSHVDDIGKLLRCPSGMQILYIYNTRDHAFPFSLPPVRAKRKAINNAPLTKAHTPPYIQRFGKCNGMLVPRMPPPPGPPAKEPSPNRVKPIPILVPIRVLSFVICTNTTGGMAKKTPENRPNNIAIVMIAPSDLAATRQNVKMPITIVHGPCKS